MQLAPLAGNALSRVQGRAGRDQAMVAIGLQFRTLVQRSLAADPHTQGTRKLTNCRPSRNTDRCFDASVWRLLSFATFGNGYTKLLPMLGRMVERLRDNTMGERLLSITAFQ